jgi:hypothetical protein
MGAAASSRQKSKILCNELKEINMASKMPDTFRIKQNELSPTKGTYHGEFNLVAWDVIDDCINERCPIRNLCTFEKSGKCGVQRQYVRSVVRVIFNSLAPSIGESTFMEIGMHIIPLYKQLCKLKIYELSVEVPVRVTERGGRVINPVFKEIRATIQLIHKMWRELRLNAPPPAGGDPDPRDPQKMDYYDQLEKGSIPIRAPEDEREKKTRLIKRKNGR